MPPKGKSKAQTIKGSFIRQFSNKRKVLSGIDVKLAEQNSLIVEKEHLVQERQKELNDIVEESNRLKVQVYEASKSLHVLQNRLQRKKAIYSSINTRLSSIETDINISQQLESSKTAGQISTTISKKRKLKPSSTELPLKAKVIRINETIEACNAIHGGTANDPSATFHGMLETLTSKCSSKDLSYKIMNSKKSLVNAVSTVAMKQWQSEYISSEENMLRSLNTYYSHNVMGKIKYLNIRKANRNAVF